MFQGLPGNTSISTAAYYGKVGLNILSGAITPSITRYDLGTNVQVRYNVSANQVLLKKPDGSTVTFGVSELSPDSEEGLAIFQRGDAGIGGLPQEVLELHVPSIGGVPLTYTRFGTYAYIKSSPAGIDPLAAFVFGQTTTVTPTTGTATYTSDLFGAVVEKGTGFPAIPNFYTLGNGHGSATFSANFGNGTVTTLINLDADGKSFGSLSGSGVILSGGPAFNGTLTGPASGGFTGAFFGPSAVEMGYVFQASNANWVTYGNVFGTKASPPP